MTAVRGITKQPETLPENVAFNAEVKASAVFENESAGLCWTHDSAATPER